MDSTDVLIAVSPSVIVTLAVIMLRRKDIYSVLVILSMFVLGMVVVLPSCFIEVMIDGAGGDTQLSLGGAFVIGTTEELAKSAVTALFVVRAKQRANGDLRQIDGIMCGVTVAAGFSLAENYFFVVMGYPALSRALAALGHATYQVIFGSAIVLALNAKAHGDKARAMRYAIEGLAVAIVLHAFWDIPHYTFIHYYQFVALGGIVYSAYQYLQSRQ